MPAARAIVPRLAPSTCACRIAAWSSSRAASRRGFRRSIFAAAAAIRFLVSALTTYPYSVDAEFWTMARRVSAASWQVVFGKLPGKERPALSASRLSVLLPQPSLVVAGLELSALRV
jgi:hypothetical protein